MLAAAARGGFAKARVAKKDPPSKELEELIARFGLRQAADAQNRAMELVTRRSTARLTTLSDFRALRVKIADAAQEIYDQTEAGVQREIQRVIAEAEASDRKPTQADVSRELRRRITDKQGFDGVFTFERASRIARTELAIADNTGIVEGYAATGIDTLIWLAYKYPIWPRRHDKMHLSEAALGEYFELPSGVKLHHPGDPFGPVGEVVHCRCTTAPKIPKPSTAPAAAPPPPPPARAPPPPPAGNQFAPRSIALIVPASLPKSYFDDPVGPVEYDEREFSRALGKLAVGLPQLEIERRARQQLNSLLARSGFVSRDVLLKKSDRDTMFIQPKVKNGPLGVHNRITGRMQIREDQVEHAQRFFGGDRDHAALDAIGTLVHEALHGHSQVDAFKTLNAVMLEEIATESASREVVEDISGKPFKLGSYQREIDLAEKIVGEELGIDKTAAHKLVRDASRTVKRSETVTDEDGLFTDFVSVFPAPNRSAIFRRLKTELK